MAELELERMAHLNLDLARMAELELERMAHLILELACMAELELEHNQLEEHPLPQLASCHT